MIQRQLVVMLKVPRPGRVKTRLGREIGMIDAAWWFRHQVTRLLRRVEDPRWALVLAVSPDHEGLCSRVWPAHLERIPQGAGDLGVRMARVMRLRPPGPVCIIGGDVPGIERTHIAQAFDALGNHDAVFGPAPDGGYWLTGLKRVAAPPARLYRNVRWSSATALEDSMCSLSGYRIALTDTLSDVDTAADLRGAAQTSRAFQERLSES